MLRALVIEDEEIINKMLSVILQKIGFEVDFSYSGNQGIEYLETYKYHLVLTDLMMSDGDGIEVLKFLRSQQYKYSVLVISALNDIDTIKNCYNLNVDDFLVKPFDKEILTAKLGSIYRKYELTQKIKLNKDEYQVIISQKKYQLSKQEFRLFNLLYSFPGTKFSKYDLINELWDGDFEMSEKVVEVSILRLRKNLGDYGCLIKTYRNLGYCYEE